MCYACHFGNVINCRPNVGSKRLDQSSTDPQRCFFSPRFSSPSPLPSPATTGNFRPRHWSARVLEGSARLRQCVTKDSASAARSETQKETRRTVGPYDARRGRESCTRRLSLYYMFEMKTSKVMYRFREVPKIKPTPCPLSDRKNGRAVIVVGSDTRVRGGGRNIDFTAKTNRWATAVGRARPDRTTL